MNRANNQQPIRVLYAGTTGRFSIPPLEALLQSGIAISGVIVPAQPTYTAPSQPDIAELTPPLIRSSLPIINPFLGQSIVQLAWQHKIPVYEIRKLRSAHTFRQLTALGATVGCVACFPHRLPSEMLDLLPHGWLNVHPSLLPDYRGPAPLFWIMRDGIEAAGVTIHQMDADLDSGPIAAQTAVALPEGVDSMMADRISAGRGGALLIDVLDRLNRGTLAYHTQTGPVTNAPWPSQADFELQLEWPARRAYNFMRGTAEWRQPYTVLVNGQQLTLSHALSYTSDEILPVPYSVRGDIARIQFAFGVLEASIC